MIIVHDKNGIVNPEGVTFFGAWTTSVKHQNQIKQIICLAVDWFINSVTPFGVHCFV
jgi:hypothetical protein